MFVPLDETPSPMRKPAVDLAADEEAVAMEAVAMEAVATEGWREPWADQAHNQSKLTWRSIVHIHTYISLLQTRRLCRSLLRYSSR